jgi:sulfur oxidation c-type cytochrome SoxX
VWVVGSLDSPGVESAPAHSPARRRALLAAALAVTVLVTAGCGASYVGASADRQSGKTLFTAKCGSCHTLADAGTTGKVGPNLDDAFRQSLLDGMTEATVRQVVRDQIAYAITTTSTGAPGMPKNLVTGTDADNVAAYIATAVAKGSAGATATPAPAPAPSPKPTPAPAPGGGTGGGTGGSSAQVAAGKAVFTGAGGCGACHTLKDAGATGNVGPNLDKVAADAQKAGKALTAYVMESIVNPNAYIVPGFPKGVMPQDFKTTLTAKQIDDLVAYITATSGK